MDDAHGFGTLGKTGAGAGEEQGCQDGIDLYFSTFAKVWHPLVRLWQALKLLLIISVTIFALKYLQKVYQCPMSLET